MSDSVQDEVVATRTGSGLLPRAQVEETISLDGKSTQKLRPDTMEETIQEGGTNHRKPLRKSVEDALDMLELAPHEQGDGDDEEEAPAESVETAPAAEGETTEETTEEAPKVDVWQEKATKLEASNRELLKQLESAKKTPSAKRTPREEALLEAERTYVDEGSTASLRRFIGAVIGHPHDSKEVSEELSGLYKELTAEELGLPLEQSHKAMRDNARTRMLLARDKREKAESTAKTEEASPSDAIRPEATQFIHNKLTTKNESGKSFADEHPMLMTLAKDLDGYEPAELVARVIKKEIQIGALDPNASETEMIRHGAKIVENHYAAVASKFAKAKPQPPVSTPDTTNSKAAPAVKPSQAASQQKAAPKLTNANASAAPAAPPKQKNAAPTEAKPKKGRISREEALRHLPE